MAVLPEICGDGNHQALALFPDIEDTNRNDAPRVKRHAGGLFNRGGGGKSNDSQYENSDDGGGDPGNPLWGSWRKIAEQTVDQQVQQGQYGGGGGGNGMVVSPDGGAGNGVAAPQAEGIVGYFKDKFGRAGVVVEQHVVHHHVHHVIHEHR